MALDRNAFIENYVFELTENINNINSTILILKKDPGNIDKLNTLLRALHTIKGSSRMLKFNTVEKIAHGLENVFKGVKENRYPINKNLVQLVFITSDYFLYCLGLIKNKKNDTLNIKKLQSVFEKAYADEPFNVEEIRLKQPDRETTVVKTETGLPVENTAGNTGKKLPMRTMTQKEETETVRIKITKLDKIIKLLNNLIIRQFQFKKENEVLKELEDKINSFTPEQDEKITKQKMDESVKLIQQLRKNFQEGIPLIERNTFEVQEEILSLRMLPLELIMGSLGKMVEETAMQIGKEIELEIKGAEVMLDKVILENIYDPVIHIVRNAIDHGIELPARRLKKGKPPNGKIVINCSSESGNIIIRIRDDGRGIDYTRLRQKAIEINPNMEEEINTMENGALNGFLFQAGFSTRDNISDLSGRGMGMDIVRHNIEKIKGKITLESEKDKGTTFILSLPMSLATVEGFFVTSAGHKFLIPSNFVKELLIIKPEDKLDLLNRKAIKCRDKIIPVYHLSDILKAAGTEEQKKLYVLIVESLGEMIGIIVDSIIQYASLVYKPLPLNLIKLKVLQGIIFDENYNIVNILFVPELLKRFKYIKNIDLKKKFNLESTEYKHVLIVDDSLSTREIEKSILEMEKYNIDTAVDGIDALARTRERQYHLIITDIDMPRMDGLTLVENLRKEKTYAKTPIIVVSSLNDPEMKQNFFKLGIDSYIIKSDFDRSNLLQEVKRLIG